MGMPAMMKTCLIAISLAVLMIAPAMGSLISLADKTAAPGEVVTMPVTIDSVAGLSSFDMYIRFDDTKLTLDPAADIVRGSLLPSSNWQVSPNPNIIENPDGYPAGDYIFFNGFSTTPFTGGSGSIVDVKFKVLATGGVVDLVVSGKPDNDSGLNDGGIPMTTHGGTITVQSVPEPAALLLMAACAPLFFIRSRRKASRTN
jgi:hypothetical protein